MYAASRAASRERSRERAVAPGRRDRALLTACAPERIEAEANAMELAERKIYCELLAQLLIVDGVFANEERAFLTAAMDRLGLSKEDRRDVYRNVNIDDPIENKLRQLDGEARLRLTEELERAAKVDDVVAASESMLIARIREFMAG